MLAVLALACLGAIVLRLMSGDPFGLPAGNVGTALGRLLIGAPLFEPSSIQVIDSRVLRVVEACIVGAALATAGVALQALLRNVLAEPFVLGLSSGAGVGVMAQTMLSYRYGLSLGPLLGANHFGAMIGAAVTMAIVYFGSRRRGTVDTLGLLLVGIVIGTINGALIALLSYLAGPGPRDNLARWMMGFLNEGVGELSLRIVAGITAAGLLTLVGIGRAMDVATLSDAEARSLGVNLGALRTTLFLVASVLAAGAVVLAGPLAFVGFIAPHIARPLVGPGHRTLVIGAAFVGATLILVADSISALLDPWLNIGYLPIGIFTAAVGGIGFLTMLRPQLGRGMD